MEADTKDNTLIDAVQSFAQCLPNLDTLVLESALPRNIGLYQVLARQYARQLKGLVCPHAQCIAAGPGIGSQLTSLEIRVDPESTALIQKVLPAQLRRLYLHNLTSSFTWHCFDRTQQQLVFANLVTLGLHYGNSDRGNGQKVVAGRLAVHLPKLRVLQVKNLPASCQLLQYVRCHANLRALEYSGAFQGLQDLSQAGITTANTLFIELSSDGPPPPPSEFAQTTNIFLDQIGTGPEGAEAKLFCHRLDPTRFPATWTNLGKLHIHASMEFDTLLNLIPYMPRLDLLIIHRLEATTEHTEIPILDLDTYVSPLPTCVRSMTLMHSALGEPSRLLVRAIKYLVLRMPSVEFLQTNQYMHEEIKRFARSFPKWHDRPHKLTVN
ncbi:hypothetical protein GGF46_002665 [Coemansia sp. RSA 552]|nr:hypothetical protein GGF46_002665 [Coemansia sp. RSA 552]